MELLCNLSSDTKNTRIKDRKSSKSIASKGTSEISGNENHKNYSINKQELGLLHLTCHVLFTHKTLIFFFLHGLTSISSPIFFLPFIFHFHPLLHVTWCPMQTKCTNKPFFFFFFTKRCLIIIPMRDGTPDSLMICLGQTRVLIFRFPQASWSSTSVSFLRLQKKNHLALQRW